jgi:hypothetical protein
MSLHMPVAKQRGSTHGKTAGKQEDLLHSGLLSSGSSNNSLWCEAETFKEKS